MSLLPSIQPAGVIVDVKFSMFFDRAGVAAGISKLKRAGLIKSGLAVMQIARRSIKRVGNAAPALRVMKTYPTLRLEDIAKLEGATEARQGVQRDAQGRFLTGSGALRSINGQITEADRRRVMQRIRQIRQRFPSPAGSPPFTHTGAMRNSIQFGYDSATESVVVGGNMPGINHILALHEFGGRQTMQAWAYDPPGAGRNPGFIGYWAVGRRPRSANWQPMGSKWTQSFAYPRRPYMSKALRTAIDRNRLAAGFGASSSMGGMPMS
jgi:hypothetical protein